MISFFEKMLNRDDVFARVSRFAALQMRLDSKLEVGTRALPGAVELF
jgi:hypothetical protein